MLLVSVFIIILLKEFKYIVIQCNIWNDKLKSSVIQIWNEFPREKSCKNVEWFWYHFCE